MKKDNKNIKNSLIESIINYPLRRMHMGLIQSMFMGAGPRGFIDNHKSSSIRRIRR